MITLVILNLGFLAVEHFWQLPHEYVIIIQWFDVLTAVIFLAEFAFELYFARDRKKYIKYHWFYLFAAVPVPSVFFEELRAVRLLRLMKLLQVFAHMRYEHNTRLFEKNGFR